jgi:hypothetical protein
LLKLVLINTILSINDQLVSPAASQHQVQSIAPCRYCVNRRFGGTYRFHLQGIRNPAHANPSFAKYTLKMEAGHSSETSVNTISTRGHIPEDDILHGLRRENRKSYRHRVVETESVILS